MRSDLQFLPEGFPTGDEWSKLYSKDEYASRAYETKTVAREIVESSCIATPSALFCVFQPATKLVASKNRVGLDVASYELRGAGVTRANDKVAVDDVIPEKEVPYMEFVAVRDAGQRAW